jgi:ppGpp synthetase/RelA/SpoT-type nucleotidyltranferase
VCLVPRPNDGFGFRSLPQSARPPRGGRGREVGQVAGFRGGVAEGDSKVALARCRRLAARLPEPPRRILDQNEATSRVTLVFSSRAVDHLGDRLRSAETIEPEDLAVLQELRRQFDTALASAQERITALLPDARPTSRLKTVQTLVAKLKRQRTMNLSQVQDVAGLRIVKDMDLAEQDEMGADIAALFDKSRIVDRRATPSFGYRALHVVVWIDGRLVEVQLRTSLQDRWAQIVERLADYWGRQIRYGDPPDQQRLAVGPLTRQKVVQLAYRLSPLIAQCEQATRTSEGARRLALSSDRYCGAVDRALAQLGRLDVRGAAQP